MPKIARFQMPDGRVARFEVPDDATPEQAHAMMEAHFAPDSKDAGASPGGFAKVPVTDRTPGSPVTDGNGAPSTMDYLRTNPVVGAPLQTLLRGGQGVEQLLAHGAASISDLGGLEPNPVSDTLHNVAETVDTAIADQNSGYEASKSRVVGASPNPRLSNAIIGTGETMGNMLNPAGMAGNAVEAAPGVLNAAARGFASGAGFGASQPVADTDNYWLRKTGQVVAGGATAAATSAAASALGSVKSPPGPSAQDFKERASEAYKRAEDQGVIVNSGSFQKAIAHLADKVEREGIDPGLHQKSTAVVSRFLREAESANPPPADETGKFKPAPGVTLEKLETLRRIANSALDSNEKSDRRIAHIIIDSLDDYVGSLSPRDLKTGSGTSPDAIAALNEARDLYARGSKLDTIDRLVEKATDKVGANYTQAGFDTALRQQFGQLKRNRAGFSRFDKAEQEAITKIIRGAPVQNFLRQLGKVAPKGTIPILSEIGAAGGALATDHPGVAASVAGLAGAGLAAQRAANKMGAAHVNALSSLVRNPNALEAFAPRPSNNVPLWNALAVLSAQSAVQPRGQ